MKFVSIALLLVVLVFALVAAQDGVPIPLSSEAKFNIVKRSIPLGQLITENHAAFVSQQQIGESDSDSSE
uniref:Putative 4.2 kDa secreted peptide n=1 Tax=Anopheles funestus TaxID=62324 RepID=Q06DF5_ANOFN|nr:putative 4.2 kda secreted peptide [Anopheles funestus]